MSEINNVKLVPVRSFRLVARERTSTAWRARIGSEPAGPDERDNTCPPLLQSSSSGEIGTLLRINKARIIQFLSSIIIIIFFMQLHRISYFCIHPV